MNRSRSNTKAWFGLGVFKIEGKRWFWISNNIANPTKMPESTSRMVVFSFPPKSWQAAGGFFLAANSGQNPLSWKSLMKAEVLFLWQALLVLSTGVGDLVRGIQPMLGMVQWFQLGLSENRVYSQWNSHLIGIMISKTIGFRGTQHFQTHPIASWPIYPLDPFGNFT